MENETVSQWVDAENVRALAEELMKPADPPAPVTPEAIYGSGFVGFAEPEPDPALKSADPPKSLESSDAGVREPVAKSGGESPDPVQQADDAKGAAISKGDPDPAPVSKSVAGPEKTPEFSEVDPRETPRSDQLAEEEKKDDLVDPRPAVQASAPKPVVPLPEKTEAETDAKERPSSVKPAPMVPPQPPVSSSPPPPIEKAVETETLSQDPLPKVAAEPSGKDDKASSLEKKPEPEKPVPVDEPPAAREVTVTPTEKPAPVVHKVRFKSPFKIVTNIDEARGESKKADPFVRSEGKASSAGPGNPPLLGRLGAFGDWLKGKVPAESYFICDLNGQVLVDEIGSSKLIDVARSLAKTSGITMQQRPAEESESLHVRISSEKVMEVIPCKCHLGVVILGLVVPRPLSKDIGQSVTTALAKALSED